MEIVKAEEMSSPHRHHLVHTAHQQQQQQQQGMSPIQRSICQALANPVLAEERDDITRQRIVFTTILRDHYDALFNGTGGPEDRAAKWEEVRQLMIEQGAHTLLDKDWKYVSGCYWQNIRKESIRRLAKLRAGALKQPRLAQIELDRAVSDIVSRRGPNSLETVVRTYGRMWTDERGVEDDAVTDQSLTQAEHDEQRHLQQHHTTPMDEHIERECLSNSASPGQDEQLMVMSNRAALVQLVRNTTASANFAGDQLKSSSTSIASRSSSMSAAMTPATTMTPLKAYQQLDMTNMQQQQQRQDDDEERRATALGKSVSKMQSLLLSGGFDAMAADFEQQIKQLVTVFKALMFDRIFLQDDSDNQQLQQTVTTTTSFLDGGAGSGSISGGHSSTPSVASKRPKLD